MGFSTSTWQPCSSAQTVISRWVSGGVSTATMSQPEASMACL